MPTSTIEKAIAFFFPFLKEESDIIFYGGEPLLAFDKIEYAVSLFHEKNKHKKNKLTFFITTNGSLITEAMLDYFNHHGFDIMLSFDGLTQDIARKRGSMTQMLEIIKQVNNYPDIKFSINSVFTPETVPYFTDSLRYIIESGCFEILVSLSSIQPWQREALDMLEKEYQRLIDFLVLYYQEKDIIPVVDFKPSQDPSPKGFVCMAGQNRIAISPDRGVWGCYLFHDYLKERKDDDDYGRYYFGKLDDFIKDYNTLYPQILVNYSELRQNFFFTENQDCFLCHEVEHCRTCPVNAAYSTSLIGKIPPWLCHLNRIQNEAKEKFLKKIKLMPESQRLNV